jgi:hypothetical protein
MRLSLLLGVGGLLIAVFGGVLYWASRHPSFRDGPADSLRGTGPATFVRGYGLGGLIGGGFLIALALVIRLFGS